MGQKVNPIGLRLGIIKTWKSKWYANKKDYLEYLHSDLKMRKYIIKKLTFSGISKVEFERAGEKIRVKIYAARPGLIIGRKGSEVDKLKDDLQNFTNGEILIDIHEVKNTEIDAQLVAQGVATQLVRRAAFRRVMKKAVNNCISNGALGIKISCSGRLGGAEMARTEGYKEGKVPLHTLRADIDYGFAEAYTTYGTIGIKVWIFKGEIIKKSREILEVEEIDQKVMEKENIKPKQDKYKKAVSSKVNIPKKTESAKEAKLEKKSVELSKKVEAAKEIKETKEKKETKKVRTVKKTEVDKEVEVAKKTKETKEKKEKSAKETKAAEKETKSEKSKKK